MASIIAFTNLKGGSGKTTTVINTAYSLMKMGSSVLVVDCDPQGNATMTLTKKDPMLQEKTIGDIFRDGKSFHEVTIHTQYQGIDLTPSNLNVASDLQAMPQNSVKRVYGFRNALDDHTSKKYDYILLDCPPSIDGAPLVNSLILADYVIIPIDGFYALAGVPPLLETINTIKKDAQTETEVLGALLTQQDGRTNASSALKSAVTTLLGSRMVFDKHIPKNITMQESQAIGIAICDQNRKSTGCAAYNNFTNEMLQRIASTK